MHALADFFSTDYGLMSAVVVAVSAGMIVWYARFFMRNIRESEQAAAQKGQR